MWEVMSIWAIADIHASRTDPSTGRPAKPMDVFGNQWQEHVERLEAAWDASVQPYDTVIIAGDTDWALHLHEATETLRRIDSWNGQKILVRGNHDYWWSSKATNKVRKILPPSLVLLHNNALQADGYNICGAKGSPVPGGIDWTDENAKLLNRELQRLLISLGERDPGLPTLAVLHYPPFYPSHPDSPYRAALEGNSVSTCVYGHLHGDATRTGPSGVYGGIRYYLVSADAVDFRPVLIVPNGDPSSDNTFS
jgi:predicted phosphohydrolase